MKFKRIYISIISVLLALCLAIPMAACNEGDVSETGTVTSVEMDRSTLNINIGEEETLTYTVLPQSAATEPAKWLSSAPDVATVTNGVVKGIKDGQAAIRVIVGDKSSDCLVTVVDPSKLPVPATGVTLNTQSLSLDVGGTAQLTATVEPENATDKTVTYSSSVEGVATVSATGLVTAQSAGQTVITARTSNNYRANCVVTVAGGQGTTELYVAKVKSLSTRETPFIMAMDSSELLSIEAARAENDLTFKDFDGNEADVLQVLKDNGITDIRIRVWNDPYDSTNTATRHGYGGGNCDVANAVALSERCAAVDLGVIIDFHYSDFWADPAKQKAPKAWAGKSSSQVQELLYNFTKKSLEEIKATGVKVTMVQVGNETTGGMAGAETEETTFAYMKKGAQAVRDTIPTAKIAVHYKWLFY